MFRSPVLVFSCCQSDSSIQSKNNKNASRRVTCILFTNSRAGWSQEKSVIHGYLWSGSLNPTIKKQAFDFCVIRKLFYWILQCRIYFKRSKSYCTHRLSIVVNVYGRASNIQRRFFSSSTYQRSLVPSDNDLFCWWPKVFGGHILLHFLKCSVFQHEFFLVKNRISL